MPILKPNISTLKDKRDVAGLLKALKDKDVHVRCAAIRALGDTSASRTNPAHAAPAWHTHLSHFQSCR